MIKTHTEAKMKCDRCGSENVMQKQITSRKNGNKYMIFECQNGCKEGKYNYSFFPPKDTYERKPADTTKTDVVELLREQNSLLAAILNALAPKQGMTIPKHELQPDEDLPF